jgi:transposase, IS5 family
LEEKPSKKPVTYRVIAKKEYLKIAKKRRQTKKQRRAAIKKQIQYVKRNLKHIEQLELSGAKLDWLNEQQYKILLVIGTVVEQQSLMYENNQQRVDEREARRKAVE